MSPFLLLQEFECGVHFGGGENSKQEWSFTLYDFDGHGKITKEVSLDQFDIHRFRVLWYIPCGINKMEKSTLETPGYKKD